MVLTDNIITLKKLYPNVWSKLKILEETSAESKVKIVEAKSGLPTIIFNDGQEQYIHSKYDPKNEAERFISQYQEEDIEKYRHVLFYGFGLGYHIMEFMKRFPEKEFSIYEPSPEIFLHTMSVRKLIDFPIKQLKNLYIEFQPTDLSGYLNYFIDNINKETLFVVFPSYERIFPNHYQMFNTDFIKNIKNKKSALNVNLAYEKLWVLNSMLNFSEVVKTPNILHDIDKSNFFNKPALLVSAGPSLEEELDNLKLIKEKGLAYIFAVGSAIKALIAHDIHPDAVCTYDPTPLNQFTYKEVIELNITDIPFIFGSSVGFETVKNYPGPKVHMIINQDTLAPFYLSVPDGALKKLADAPSIAVVTLELLAKLGCNPIILVGQNLAFKKDRWYAAGIHEDQSERLAERIKSAEKNFITVEDVYGGQVFTEESFNRMRGQMEYYISVLTGCKVINTTKGGAKITGTEFVPLENLLTDSLTKKVVSKWLSQEKPRYSKEYQIKKAEVMERSYEECDRLFDVVAKIIVELRQLAEKNNTHKIDNLLTKFDKCFKKLHQNKFFQVFLLPMNRVRFEILLKIVSEIRLERNMIEKAKNVEKNFGAFIYDCKKDVQLIYAPFRLVQNTLLNDQGDTENCGKSFDKSN